MSRLDLVVIIPMLGRPHRVRPVLRSIQDSCDARVIFGVTRTDHLVRTELDQINAEYETFDPREVGDYAHKINTLAALTVEPLIFTGADDLHFHPGWLDAAKAQLAEGIGVVGTNDLGNPAVLKGVHSTHSLVTRDYLAQGLIDGKAGVYSEAYWHEFCDNEMVEVAMKRKAWAFAFDSIVEHLHPAHGKAESDATYQQIDRRTKQGAAMFYERRSMWT